MTKTKILKINPDSPDENTIEFAATLLRDGWLVAFPTETVYGIGANFMDKKAVKRLYEIKKRPLNKPFTIHISNIDMINRMHCEISPLADQLIKNFWPGPLTIILRLTDPDLVGQGGGKKNPSRPTRSGIGKLGFRMPRNTVAKELISKSGVPLAAPSANISGEKPPTQAGEVLDRLDGKIDLILDSGKTDLGRESTVVDATSPLYKILRKGAIPETEIAGVLSEIS